MAPASLTDKQQQLFDTIVEYVRDHDQWPPIPYLADELGYKSPNSITQLYESLIKKGYIVKTGWGSYSFHPVQQFRVEQDRSAGAETEEGIPIVGYITAGGMQEAVEDEMGKVTLRSILPNYQKVRAVVVSGDSMKEAGINNGDIVLLARTDLFDGDIGAIRYRGETTLKRVYHSYNRIKLYPANEEYEPIIIEPGEFEEVQIIGKYVGHINEHGLHKA